MYSEIQSRHCGKTHKMLLSNIEGLKTSNLRSFKLIGCKDATPILEKLEAMGYSCVATPVYSITTEHQRKENPDGSICFILCQKHYQIGFRFRLKT